MTDAPLALEHLRAAAGERTTGMIAVDLGSATVQIPIVLINGARPGPRVGATAGIHGAEYVSIAALRRVAMSLDPAEMTGSMVASLVSNPAAFAARAIYVDPLDGRNLNRSFPGDPAGSPTERLAAWLYANVLAPSDRFIDCHCGDMNEALVSFTGIEETGDPEVDRVALAMAEAYGLDYLVYGPIPGATTTTAAAAGIPAVLGEVGGQGRWPEEDVALHAAGLRRALHAAGLIPDPGDGPRRRTRVLRAEAWLRSEATGFWHPSVDVGERVEKGQGVGEVQDAFGAVLQHVTAPIGGVVLFLVSSLAMNAGDPLLAIAD
jgi:predicted deacylase